METVSQVQVGATLTAYGVTVRVTHVCKSRRTKGWYKIQGVDSSGQIREFELRGSDRLTR